MSDGKLRIINPADGEKPQCVIRITGLDGMDHVIPQEVLEEWIKGESSFLADPDAQSALRSILYDWWRYVQYAMHGNIRADQKTLHDELVIAVLQGELAAREQGLEPDRCESLREHYGHLAAYCHDLADALLAERARRIKERS